MIYPLPLINESLPIYIYGTGVIGISYKRQLEELGKASLIKGFIETNPTKNKLFNFNILSIDELSNIKLAKTQILIASHSFSSEIVGKLTNIGFKNKNIIQPGAIKWRGTSIFLNKKFRSISIYPTIDNFKDFNIIYKTILKKLNKFTQVDKPEFHMVTSFETSKSIFDNKNIKITNQNNDSYPKEIIKNSDINILFKSSFFNKLDDEIKEKTYFYNYLAIPGYSQRTKYFLAKKMQVMHNFLLKKIKNKAKINVVFLVHGTNWKVDSVFKLMRDEPYFNPSIFIAPNTLFGEKEMWNILEETTDFFKKKDYPLNSAYCKNTNQWLDISTANPDIVFFTNSHGNTFSKYYDEIFNKYLSCYVPYFFDIASKKADDLVYNQHFHNAMWKIFLSSDYSNKKSKDIAANKGCNTYTTGYPDLEFLVRDYSSNINAWKKQDTKKLKIIYAPHQSIKTTGILQLSTFLEVAYDIKKLALDFKDKIQWSFKPHPALKYNLYKHPDWGVEKTNEYYYFWEKSSFTQLDSGSYMDLFKQSDAIIHDCSSFIFEYLLVKKPCAFLNLKGETQTSIINEFGLEALNSYRIIKQKEDIKPFIYSLIENNLDLLPSHKNFVNRHIKDLYIENSPPKKIINIIKKGIKG